MLPLTSTLDNWSGDKAMEYFNASVLCTRPSLRDSRSKERMYDLHFDNQPIHEYHPSNEGEKKKCMQRDFEVAEKEAGSSILGLVYANLSHRYTMPDRC